MAARAFLVTALVLFCFVQVLSDLDHIDVDDELQKEVRGGDGRLLLALSTFCNAECKRRCGLHSRPNLCQRACGTCCFRCRCVPPGTAGNREKCGTCYTNMTTHGNKPKCP